MLSKYFKIVSTISINRSLHLSTWNTSHKYTILRYELKYLTQVTLTGKIVLCYTFSEENKQKKKHVSSTLCK